MILIRQENCCGPIHSALRKNSHFWANGIPNSEKEVLYETYGIVDIGYSTESRSVVVNKKIRYGDKKILLIILYGQTNTLVDVSSIYEVGHTNIEAYVIRNSEGID